MILTQHIPILDEILATPGFLAEPILSFGYNDVVWYEGLKTHLAGKRAQKEDSTLYMKLRAELAQLLDTDTYSVKVPWQFMENQFNQILSNYGRTDVTTIDLFDPRAEYAHDMNLPIDRHLIDRFNTIVDIGSTEHVFDTRQCLDNLFKMLRVGGHIMFHLPCSGCFDHGFFTFSPEAIIQSLRLNGFAITYLAYSFEPEGFKMEKPLPWNDCIMWCAARKMRAEKQFIIPQQNGCKAMYGLEALKQTT